MSLYSSLITNCYIRSVMFRSLITMLVFVFETKSEEILLHLVYDLPTHYQIVYVRNFIHRFENVRNLVQNCPKSIIISSENFCPKIKCPKIKRPKILEINVVFFGIFVIIMFLLRTP